MMTLLQSALTGRPTIHNMENLRHLCCWRSCIWDVVSMVPERNPMHPGRKKHGNGCIFTEHW